MLARSLLGLSEVGLLVDILVFPVCSYLKGGKKQVKLKLTAIRPVWLLVLVASTTGLLVYALGNYQAPDFIKYFNYLYSTFALIILCANLPRIMCYILRKIKHSHTYHKIKKIEVEPYKWLEELDKTTDQNGEIFPSGH